MRRAARVDANQSVIIGALLSVGASVQTLASMGGGVPDLLVGFKGRNILIEVKDGSKPASARQLTGDQIDWHCKWRGQVAVIENVEQALALLVKGEND